MSLHRYRNEKGEEVFDVKELMQTLHEGDMICMKSIVISIIIGVCFIPFIVDYVVPFLKKIFGG